MVHWLTPLRLLITLGKDDSYLMVHNLCRCGTRLASFPGLPTVQFFDRLQTVGKPGNKAGPRSTLTFIAGCLDGEETCIPALVIS